MLATERLLVIEQMSTDVAVSFVDIPHIAQGVIAG